MERIEKNYKVKRIVMIIEAWKPIWAGGQVVAYELGKRLSENYGVRVDLFVMNLDGKKVEKINPLFRVIRVGKKRAFSFFDRLAWIREVYREIIKHHKKKRYDLIYAHANLPGIVGKILSKKLGIPVVYHVHGSGIEAMQKMYGKGLKSWTLYLIESILQRWIKYDLEITVDRKFLKYKNRNKPVYIPNGVDIEKFDKVKTRKEKKFFKILFVGRLHPQKGLIYLVEAARLIKKELEKRNVKFVIVGDGEEKEKLIRKIKEYRLEKLFVFKGKLYGEKLIKEYKSSHLFILPSLYEGMPLTVLEAWASKLSVLVTRVGDLPYIVKEGKNGWLIEPENLVNLSNKLRKIINLDQKSLNKIGRLSYKFVKENYDWKYITYKIYYSIRKLI